MYLDKWEEGGRNRNADIKYSSVMDNRFHSRGGGSGFFLVGPDLFGRDPNKTRQKDGTIWGKNVNKIPVKTKAKC